MALYLGLFLLSAATLLFEINLTRLFSVAQFYHFAFMIVSLALLGFGASGSALALFPRWGRRRPERTLAWLGIGFALTSLGGVALVNLLPFDSFSIAWERKQIGILALHYLALAAPFFCSGAAVGLLLAVQTGRASRVYLVNLFGSAAGCLLAILTPGMLGGERVAVLCGLLAIIAAGLFDAAGGRRLRQPHFWLTAPLTILCLIALARPPDWLAIRLSPYKDLSYALNAPEARVLSSRWNAFSRVDLVDSPFIRSLPGLSYRYTGPLPRQQGLTVDGGDLTGVITGRGDLEFADHLPTGLAYRLRPAAETLLLEPHGGLDILVAQALGARSITAVEPNPLIVEAAGAIYSRPGVEVVAASGRSYARGTDRRFDLVTVSLTAPYRPVRSGAYSLAEDYRYTVEAFASYLDLLAPGGILQATRWLQSPPSEETRLFALAVESLVQQGVDPAGALLFCRGFNTATVLVKPAGFTAQELGQARTWLAERSFDLVFAPDVRPEEVNRYNILQEPVYYQAAVGLLNATDREAWYEGFPFDVTPPTDNHPFFGHFFKWSQAAEVLQEAGHTWQPFGGAGYFVLVALLLLATAAALIIILLPLAAGRSAGRVQSAAAPHRIPSLAYFGFIGLGFLLGEIPLAQQFILFLGQPVYGLTAVLFALLFFSGLGSWASGRLPHRAALLALVAILLAYPLLLPQLFGVLLGSALGWRMAAAVIALAPLGFLLGVPLPAGIGWLEQRAPDLIPWAWGVNGAASVVAAVSAALLALSFGFSWVLIAGALCYAGALVALRPGSNQPRS